MNKQKGYAEIVALGGIILLVIVLIAAWMFVYPNYRVWSQEMRGKAALAEATQSKMIQIEQARGELEASELRSKAIAVIGKSAKEFPEYREQEFIGAFGEALRDGTINQIIYVPTEGNIPVLEAGKRPKID